MHTKNDCKVLIIDIDLQKCFTDSSFVIHFVQLPQESSVYVSLTLVHTMKKCKAIISIPMWLFSTLYVKTYLFNMAALPLKSTLIDLSLVKAFLAWHQLFFQSMSSSRFPQVYLIEAQAECGPISLSSAKC